MCSLFLPFNFESFGFAYYYCIEVDFVYSGSSAFNVSIESASVAGLSVLQRSIRGKRTATPDLCLVDFWIPSNPSSKTSSGLTTLTGPYLPSVFLSNEAIQPCVPLHRSSLSKPWLLARGCHHPKHPKV